MNDMDVIIQFGLQGRVEEDDEPAGEAARREKEEERQGSVELTVADIEPVKRGDGRIVFSFSSDPESEEPRTTRVSSAAAFACSPSIHRITLRHGVFLCQ